jgi:hypothetical protein
MFEAEVVALGEVEGDDVAIESLTGRLKGLFVGGSERKEVTVGVEVTDTEVLGRVGENEGCAAEDLHACGCGEGERGGYR